MRVLFVNSVCRSGSTGKIVYDLYSQLRADGHDAAVCYGRGNLCEGENITCFAPKWEVYLHALLTRITGLTGYYSPIATRRLLRLIDEYQPDVVHLHELHAYFVNHLAVMRHLRKRDIKTVWTFHCEYMYTGKCGHAYECERWQQACGSCPHMQDYPKVQWFDLTHKMLADKKKAFDGWDNLTIATPSQWLADRVKQSFLSDKNTLVVHNGIDTDNVFYPRPFEHLRQRHGLTDEKLVLAVAPGLMSTRKGGHYVLRLAEKLKNERIKFILIGVDDLSEQFPDNVIALGRTENQLELAEYYSMADVFVICSEKETFSLTCAESMACGTPVVGFCAGAPETIFPEPYGIFVEHGDVEELSKAVQARLVCRSDAQLDCVAFGQRAFSKDAMCSYYVDIYS